MSPATKNCWATFAVDEISARKAVMLAKSLTHVATAGDIIVFTSYEIGDTIRKHLLKYFDSVIPLSIESNSFSVIDILKVAACNLQMYTKCVAISPHKMVLKNCDELFDFDWDFAAQYMKKNNCIDDSILVFSPKFCFFSGLAQKQLGGKFKNLSEIFDTLSTQEDLRERFQKLPISYNCYVNNSKLTWSGLASAKIVDFGPGSLKMIQPPESVQETIVNWISVYNAELNGITFEPFLWLEKYNWASPMKDINKRHCYKDAIAIVGQSCRFPCANNVDEFWDLLISGGDGISQIPQERLLDFQRNDSRYTDSRGGFLKCPVDEFDAKFFGISPREATSMDPQQRLLLEIAWEALENAAINPQTLKGGNTGVFTGVWTHDYERLVVESASAQDFHHVILGNSFSATSARVSYFLGLNGPNIAIESGCSSSMVGIHLACESLRKKETDLSLVLGANILVIHFPYSVIPILAKDGHCKTFDESADGFGRAEGIAGIVLKRLPDAIANGDRILGIIRGSGISNEGTTGSFGTPSKHCQEIAVKEAIKNACIEPREVDYVEAHGTGTPVGDPIEFAALSAAYGVVNREKPLIVGSVKTNTGHTESAAGLAGIIKIILAMKHETIPPHRNFTKINPNIDLSLIPAVIPLEREKWERDSQRSRIAGASSFGISGTNVHVIVEEPFVEKRNTLTPFMGEKNERSHQIITFSAKSENALMDLWKRYIEYFETNPQINVADVAFTANTGRASFEFRSAIVGRGIEEFKSNLRTSVYSPPTLVHSNSKPKIAFLFTGQGSQYFGMGKGLYESNVAFRDAFDECECYIQNAIDISLKKAFLSDSENHLLENAMYSQLSIFAVEYSLLKLWESLDVKYDFVLGHSIGEFAASVAAGILNINEAIDLIVERSKLVEALQEGGMLAIKASKDIVSELIAVFLKVHSKVVLDIASINSPSETVVAGSKDAVILFKEFCSNNGRTTQLLVANRGFHSREMDAIVERFYEFSKRYTFKDSTCHYVSGMTGECLSPGELESSYWAKHMREPVNFEKGVATLIEKGCTVFIEIGSHPVLLALGMSNHSYSQESIWLPSLRRNEANWRTILDSLAQLYTNKVNINWSTLDITGSRNKLELPTYPFQRQKYWVEYQTDNFSIKVHPLLGKRVSLAEQSAKVYENCLNLKEVQYLKDHQVANLIIFPGAAFLEMILASGMNLVNKSNFQGMTVTDFAIDAPLELTLDKDHKLQTVMQPMDENGGNLKTKIYMFQNLNGYNEEKGWKQYAGATLDINSSNLSKIDNTKHFTEEKIDEIKLRCPEEHQVENFYKHGADVGLDFGECFRSINMFWKGQGEILAEIPAPSKEHNTSDNYIYHPIVLDAMIQIFSLTLNEEDKDMYLPVAVGKFSAIALNPHSKRYFGHVTYNIGQSNASVFLYSENNELLAVMEGIVLVRSSMSSLLNIVNSQKNRLPGMYQEVWRSRDGPLQSRVDLSNEIQNSTAMFEKVASIVDEKRKAYNECIPLLEKSFCTVHILKFLYKVNWVPTVEETVDCRSFITSRGFSLSLEPLINRIFDILCEDGYLRKDYAKTSWTVIQAVPSIHDLDESCLKFDNLVTDFEKRNQKGHMFTDIFRYCIDQLPMVCSGELSPHAVLFGNEDPLLNASKIYTDSDEIGHANACMSAFLQLEFENIGSVGNKKGSALRILEVGAGSGATTKEIVNGLKKSGIPYRYTFTDISPHFINEAKSFFQNDSDIEYQLLDVEKDPLTQGFAPYNFDIVVASNVIHATSSLIRSLRNVRLLLRNNGILLLQELLGPKRQIDIIFGILDGYWKFNDYDIRPNHPCVTKDVWDLALTNSGFLLSDNLSDTNVFSILSARVNNAFEIEKALSNQNTNKSWILYCDNDGIYKSVQKVLESIGRQVFLLKNINDQHGKNEETNCYYINPMELTEVESCINKIFENFDVEGCCYLRSLSEYSWDDQSSICLPALNIIKYFVTHNRMKTRFYIATSGVYHIGNQKNMFPYKATLVGMLKSAANEFPDFSVKLLELDPDCKNPQVYATELCYEFFTGTDIICSFRGSKKFVMRFCQTGKPSAPLPLPSGRYTVVVPHSKKIEDITFCSAAKIPLEPDEIEVAVKAVALNFRDLFVILQPEQFSTKYKSVGTDFAGVVTDIGSSVTRHKIGDKVFGIAHNSCAASHVIVDKHLALTMPKSWTFSEGSTIPSVLLTCHYCLVTVADLKKNDTILIHVASGGVGLIAIQIAKHIGARIIATAGSHRKRAYLRSIGIGSVFHSRDLTYESEIAKVTNGQGVDVVINSLTGPGFKEATLRSCGAGARFIEIGKVNIWQPDEVHQLRPDVNYSIVDLETTDNDVIKEILDAMHLYSSKFLLSPLPFSKFSISHIQDALNYFSKAEHIGKIVLAMPEYRDINGQQIVNDFSCDEFATYLITGGLKGIGLEVARWLADCGAKNLILVARSLPDESALKIIGKLRSAECRVEHFQVDVGDTEQCSNLFDIINSPKYKWPPLRGIIHSAVVISDGTLANQTWEKIQTVFNPKVAGTLNLHNLSLNHHLDFFLCFSSLAGMVGSMGQSNYSAANMFVDSLVHYRNNIGLPAQTINWGPWAQIGSAANMETWKYGKFGVGFFTPAQGIAALKFVLSRPNVKQVTVAQLDPVGLLAFFGNRGNYLTELIVPEDEDSANQSINTNSEAFWLEIGPLDLTERTVIVKNYVAKAIRNTLRLPDSEKLDEFQNFSDMGLDSLMGVEIKNKLQNVVGKQLPLNATALIDNPTISGLSSYLAEKTFSVDTTAMVTEKLPKKNTNVQVDLDLIKLDSILPEGIQAANYSFVKPSEIKNVFVTGVTGQVGLYILRDLLKISELNIFCLIRGKSVEHARKKLVSMIKKYHLEDDINVDKLLIFVGDITENNLGLSVEDFDNLSTIIDCIIHLAVRANHIERYEVGPPGVSNVRSVNVLGTVNVLRFASNIKTKRVFYSSSYTTVNRLNKDGFAYEDFPEEENNADELTWGYVISKFICEKLMKQANERGIPCTIVRYSPLTGDSQTGEFAIEKNSFLNYLLMCVRYGVIADVEGGWCFLPVDIASSLTVKLIFNDDAETGVYNFTPPFPLYTKDFVEGLSHFGFNLNVVTPDEFETTIIKGKDNDVWLSIFIESYGADIKNALFKATAVATLLQNKERVYNISDKLLRAVPDFQERLINGKILLNTYLRYAQSVGMLKNIDK